MDYFTSSEINLIQTSEEVMNQHVAQLRIGARRIKEASATAKEAAAKLAEKLHLTDLKSVPVASIDLAQIIMDFSELPNELPECCIFCYLEQAEKDSGFTPSQAPAAQVGPYAILNTDPRNDNDEDAVKRRMAAKSRDRKKAKLTGGVAKADADCCVVCPYHFREVERLEEAHYIQGLSRQPISDKDKEEKEEKDKVFLEVETNMEMEMETESPRRRRHHPNPCCPACPSQFLIAHAFPENPWRTEKTTPQFPP